ncbi:MAG: lipid-binding protein [Sinomicrobium sp.]|nr:lipid-binding protein [Sinomicrobium sp.]
MMPALKNTRSFQQNATAFFLFVLLLNFHKNHAQEWELKKDKNGIQIYTRQPEDARIKEYKAVVLVKTSVAEALKVITDGDNLWKWNYKTSDSKIVKTISETEFVFWIKNDLPWPIKNRDLLSRVTVLPQKDGAITVTIAPETTHTFFPEKNITRIRHFNGHWLLIPRGDHVEITQQLYGDPGGTLPAWLVNALITNAPYRTFLNLKEILEN